MVVSGLAAATRGIVPTATTLFADALPSSPYFVPQHFILLYVGVPLSILAALALVTAPGVLLVLTAGGDSSSARFVVRSFGAAFAANVVLLSALKLIGLQMSDHRFVAAQIGITGLLAVLLAIRVWKGQRVAWPLADHVERRRLCWLVAIPLAAALVLLPVILWQDLTEDGIEALEIGRSLTTFIVPRFAHAAEFSGLGNPLLSASLPVSWFVALYGPIEAAARVPLLLYLPVLFMAVLALIEWRSQRRLTLGEESAVALALAIFVVTMGYSASYDPYSADLATPAAHDTLLLISLTGAVLFLWSSRPAWFLLFALMGYFVRPTGLLSILFLGMTGAIFLPRSELARVLAMTGLAALACLVAGFLYESYLHAAASGRPIAYAGGSLLERVRFLQFGDLRRAFFVAIPAGLIPSLALFYVRRQDPYARMLTAFTVLYFFFFYLQAFVALHHFAPAMILPIVVLWRIVLQGPSRRWLKPAVYAAAAVCLVLSLPRSFEVLRAYRVIGSSISFAIGSYEGDYSSYRSAIEARTLIFDLFPAEWDVRDPAIEFVGAPTSMMRYSFVRDGGDVNYVVQPPAEKIPAGFTRVAGDERGSVSVRDTARWRRERFSPPRTDYRSPVYDIPRETLFEFVGRPARNYDVNLRRLPFLGRLF